MKLSQEPVRTTTKTTRTEEFRHSFWVMSRPGQPGRMLRAIVVFVDDKFTSAKFDFVIDSDNRDHLAFAAAVNERISQIESRKAKERHELLYKLVNSEIQRTVDEMILGLLFGPKRPRATDRVAFLD